MEVTGLILGVVPAVVELYHVAEAAYDLYHEAKDFRSSYHELYVCLEIERFRIKLWGEHVLSESHLEEAKTSPSELKLFELFESILRRVCDTFSESSQRMSTYSDNTRSEHNDGKRNSVDHIESAAGDDALKKSYQRCSLSLTYCYRRLASC